VRLPSPAYSSANKLPDNDPQKKVVVDYKKAYEDGAKQPVSTFGGYAYDGLSILIEAMKARKLDRSQESSRRNREDHGLCGHHRNRQHVAPPTIWGSISQHSVCLRSKAAIGTWFRPGS